MSNWYLIALVVVAVAGFVLLRYRNTGTSRSQDALQGQAPSRLGQDYANDREDARLAHMSAEDRAWESASLLRNQAIQERSATPAQ